MTDPRSALTPDALTMMDAIASSGSFAAAARQLGKVPSALTYSVRQLEEALDVLLFDRRSRQATLTAAGQELLDEGRRLLESIDAVAHRVKRVATGWETQLSIVVDDVVSRATLLDLCADFYAGAGLIDAEGRPAGAPPTRLRLATEVLAGTWEALVTGRADLAIGVGALREPASGVTLRELGPLVLVFALAPQHPLAGAAEPIGNAELLRHRAVAVADSAQRLEPITMNLLPGQEVLTVNDMQAKIDALMRGLGCGFVPEPMVRAHVAAGRLLLRRVEREQPAGRLAYAWRTPASPRAAGGRKAQPGLALRWWLDRLDSPATRTALLERHARPVGRRPDPVTPYVGRFAPSPSGLLHAGSLVAALASWLDARANGGRWLVRIEDLDTARNVAGAAEAILEQLARCGLLADEPPSFQSSRTERYQRALAQLIAGGDAYPCGCSRRDLASPGPAADGQPGQQRERVYPGTCRGGLNGRTARSVRLRTVPALASDDGAATIAWLDRRLGVQRENVALSVGDFILHRADGVWAYQLAVVVDDAAQGITDVVRGEDLASNTARQILLQHRLDLPTPRYLHTPLVRTAAGEKLSKQTGAAPLDPASPLAALRAAAATLGLAPGGTTIADWLAGAVAEWRRHWPLA